MFFSSKFKKGFSLVELLVVIAIIGILTAIVVSRLDEIRADSRDVKRISDMREVSRSLESYYQDFGGYPSCENGGEWCGSCDSEGQGSFAEALQPLVDDSEIPIIPADPINNSCLTYSYITPPTIVEGMCGDKYVDDVGYVLRFTLEHKTMPWDVFSENLATGTTYCITGEDISI